MLINEFARYNTGSGVFKTFQLFDISFQINAQYNVSPMSNLFQRAAPFWMFALPQSPRELPPKN